MNVVKFSRTISVPHTEVLITFEISVLAPGALHLPVKGSRVLSLSSCSL